MREAVNSRLHEVGRAVAFPLVKDDAQSNFMRLLHKLTQHAVRKIRVTLQQIHAGALVSFDDARNLGARGNRVSQIRPRRIRGVNHRAHTIDSWTEDVPARHFLPQLQNPRLIISRVENCCDSGIEHRVEVALIAEQIHADSVPPTLRVRWDPRAAGWPRILNLFLRDDDRAVFDRRAAKAVNNPCVNNGDRLLVRGLNEPEGSEKQNRHQKDAEGTRHRASPTFCNSPRTRGMASAGGPTPRQREANVFWCMEICEKNFLPSKSYCEYVGSQIPGANS